MHQPLTQMELQNLRELISSHQLGAQKLQDYANQAMDPQVKQMFQQAAQSAKNTEQKLMLFLQ